MSRREWVRGLTLGCALLSGVLLPAGCTSGTTLGSSGTVALSSPSTNRTTAAALTSTTTPTLVTPNGLITESGITDTAITLGVLVDSAVDRGFTSGVALWRKTVNAAGGICGRQIITLANDKSETLPAAYARLAGSTIGLITLPSAPDLASISALSRADQIPTLTLTGSSAELDKSGPVVIGATEDIKAINALAYVRSVGGLKVGSEVGVLTDSSPAAQNALAGVRWWASRNGVSVLAQTADSPAHPAAWTGSSAVLVIAAPAQVQATLASTPPAVQVITNLDGYDPSVTQQPAGRLLVTLAAPAFGSDNPGAAAVAKAFVNSGLSAPGAQLISGYGVGAAWARLLAQACTDRKLTHAGVTAAMTTVGPASVDSLFGPSDPGLVIGSALPATRVSSVALADPLALAGLRPLIWLQSAAGISGYVPTR